MHSAVVNGVVVCAVQKAICCVLLHQCNLELGLHVQGEEKLLYPPVSMLCLSVFTFQFLNRTTKFLIFVYLFFY